MRFAVARRVPSTLRVGGYRSDERIREGTVYPIRRQRRRIVASRPIRVGIDDENGLPLAYGVIPNVSEAGACVWTSSQLEPAGRLVLRIRFGHRHAEVHRVAARVVWTRDDEDPLGGAPMRRVGLEWQDFTSAHVPRLLDLVQDGQTPPPR
jgi:hypothetical protein